ncbi:class I SAM-dependent methyltransferase [Chitinophaga sp. 30R24]|uniref:class I SAM-dependent methyltransferase n=1 Tax=Chitinophaga sp. 30R24 TaxID=3248838 RepID=UPI003B91EA5B
MSRLPASKTGLYMAAFRAIENIKPEKDRLINDPFAAGFLSKAQQVILACCSIKLIRNFVTGCIQLRWPGTFTAAIARTRLIDDMIVEAVRTQGINQVIIVNATFDTRPHRLNVGLPLHYVEVDHPEIQMKKRKLLTPLLNIPAVPVDYVQLDMSTQQMSDVIPQLLFRKHYKTLFLWEKLTTSQDAEKADIIFQYLKSFPSGTQVIFTYVNKVVLENPDAFYGFKRIKKLLRRDGEHWDFGLHPSALHQFMEARNMQVCYDGGAADYRSQYFGAKSNRMKGYEYFRVVRAEVK